MEIVPSTAEHIKALYGESKTTIRAVSAVEDGVVHGIAGIYKDKGKDVVFVKMDDEVKKHPRLIIKAARQVMGFSNMRQIFSIQDKCLDTSDSFLRHFGFKPLVDGVYVWTK